MSLSTRLARALTAPWRGLKQLAQMVFPNQRLSWLSLPRTRYDYAADVGDGLASSVVVAPVLWAARTFPEAPLALWRRTSEGLERVHEHPLLGLVEYPNPHYSGALLWMATVVDYLVTGNAYWLKARDRRGRVAELWYAPASLIEPVRPVDGSAFLSHYEYRPGPLVIQIPPSDVVHFRYGIDPANTMKGLSPLASLVREVFTDEEAANFTAAILRNLGLPGVVISPSGDLPQIPPEEHEALAALWKQRFTGDHRGEPLLATFPVQVTTLGWSPSEIDVRSLRRIPEERVTAVLGVPAIVAGLGAGLDRSTFSNFAEAREAAYESLIIPMQRILAAEIQTQLLPEFEREFRRFRVGFDISEVRILQEDTNAAAERWETLVRAGIATRAEARAYFGLPVQDEVDNVYLIPLNVVAQPAVPQPEPEPPPALPQPQSEAGDAEPESEAEPGMEEAAKQFRLVGVKAPSRVQARLVQALARDAERLEQAFARELVVAFTDLGERAAAAYLELAQPKRANGHHKAADPLDEFDEFLLNDLLRRLRLDDWRNETLAPLFQQHYLRVLTMTVDTVNGILELGINLPDEVARRVVELGGKRVGLVDLDDATRDALFQALAEARALGEGPPDAARRIRTYVPAGRFVNAGPAYRSLLIARTETKYAQNVSSLLAYQQSPVITGVMAFDGQLRTSDDECRARNGQVFSFDEAVILTEEEHPNGTLSWAPVTRE